MEKWLVIQRLNNLSNNISMLIGAVRHYHIIRNQHRQIELTPMAQFDPIIRRGRNRCRVTADQVNMSYRRLPTSIQQKLQQTMLSHNPYALISDTDILNTNKLISFTYTIRRMITKLKTQKSIRTIHH